MTIADLMRGNSTLQEKFAQRDVIFHAETPQTPTTPMTAKMNGQVNRTTTPITVNVIQGLLDLALVVSFPQAFDVRLAAVECIKAYLYGHGPIRLHFLQRAKEGHLSQEYEADNVLTILLEDVDRWRTADPYRQWIAAVLLFHLLHEDYEAKSLAMAITEGDAERGEEVVTCIQTLSGNLISKSQKGDDDRAIIGYLMVLSGWLYENPDAVSDFLQEGSNVQSLIQMVLQPSQQKVLVAGLCAFLLGIIYEFSSKDSPVPRATLHDILSTSLGREQFNDKMTKLREHPFVRDYEVLPQGFISDQAGSLPEVYFDKTFIDFLKDNFSRVLRAIDRDPGIEISVVANGIQKGISRELVDSLKSQVEDRGQALQKAESELLTLERKLGQEQADHRKAKESATIELGRIKSINESLQKNHEEETRKMQEGHQRAISDATKSVEKVVASMQAETKRIKDQNESIAAKVRARHEAEVEDLKASLGKLEKQLEKATKDHAQDLRTAHEEYSANTEALEARLRRADEKAEEAEMRTRSAQKEAEDKERARASVQTELDDLFVVLGDLEEKRSGDKVSVTNLPCKFIVAGTDCCRNVSRRLEKRFRTEKRMRMGRKMRMMDRLLEWPFSVIIFRYVEQSNCGFLYRDFQIFKISKSQNPRIYSLPTSKGENSALKPIKQKVLLPTLRVLFASVGNVGQKEREAKVARGVPAYSTLISQQQNLL